MIFELFKGIKIDFKVFVVIVRFDNTYFSDWNDFFQKIYAILG